MSPPSPPLPPGDDISIYWTDEELCMSLDKMIQGSRLPGNVIPDVNPFQYKPSDLPAEVWYFMRSGIQKEADTGSWKAIGEACRIFTNPVIAGWRTTYKYYEGHAPNERQTDWVMQEYRLTKGMHEFSWPKDAGSLCRVFHSNVQSPNNEMQQNLANKQILVGGDTISSILSELLGEENNRNGQGFTSRSDQNLANKQILVGGDTISSILSELLGEENNRNGQGFTSRSDVKSGDDETNTVPVTEGLLNDPVQNLPEIEGDYLELLDLAIPASPSSSSENSSCLSMNSDEHFDSLALLRDLESEDKNDQQPKNANCKFSILASVRPDEVIMHLASAGSLTTNGNRNKTPAEALKTDSSPPGSVTEKKSHDKTLVKPPSSARKAENDNGGPSSKSGHVAASSSGHKAARVREKEAVTGKKKKLNKYFCFMPF